jgi:hypothetical protein
MFAQAPQNLWVRHWHSGKRGTRGRPSSPSATLGEERHSRTKNDVGKWRYLKNTLPRVPFPSTRGSQPLPRVPHPSTRGSKPLPRVPPPALGEGSLPRVPGKALGELFFQFFVSFFCEVIPHYLKLLPQILGYFEFFCYISSVFSFC